MKIVIVTPASRASLSGNRTTAERWKRVLRRLGHRVEVVTRYDDEPCDVLVALHARKSHDSARRFRRRCPELPLVVALTGTDIYRDVKASARARETLGWATRLIALQPLAIRELPPRLRRRARVIHQTAARRRVDRRRRSVRTFDVCVAGHLRPVKDPLRAALAARLLPADSRVRVLQAGAALGARQSRRARAEEKRNPRYRWLGEVPRWSLHRVMDRSRVLVLSSRLEGGANVVSEAVAGSLPILASRIPGNVGLLGADYGGYFPVADTRALANLLRRAETDAEFLRGLEAQCKRLESVLAEPAAEGRAWTELLREVARDGPMGSALAGE